MVGKFIYGLSQSHYIFFSLTDKEFSLIKFVGDIIEGETEKK